MKETFPVGPRIRVLAYPSRQLNEQMIKNESERIEKQRTNLGKEGLQKAGEAVANAIKSQILPPQEVLESGRQFNNVVKKYYFPQSFPCFRGLGLAINGNRDLVGGFPAQYMYPLCISSSDLNFSSFSSNNRIVLLRTGFQVSRVFLHSFRCKFALLCPRTRSYFNDAFKQEMSLPGQSGVISAESILPRYCWKQVFRA